MDEINLKPCPFCGESDLFFGTSKSPDLTITYHHLGHGPSNRCTVKFTHGSKEAIIEMWQTRK